MSKSQSRKPFLTKVKEAGKWVNPNVGSRRNGRRVHDTGLTMAERSLVHAIREIFDPKQGKEVRGSSEKMCDLPKGKRSEARRKGDGMKKRSSLSSGADSRNVTGESSRKTTLAREKLVTVKVNGQIRSTRIKIPLKAGKAGKRRIIARAEACLSQGQYTDKRTVAPSRIRRSERRQDLAKKLVKDEFDHDQGGVFSEASLQTKRTNILKARGFWKRAPLTSVSLVKDFEGLEVEVAFGGSGALQMLRMVENVPKGQNYKHKVYTGRVERSSLFCTRDFNIAAKGLSKQDLRTEKIVRPGFGSGLRKQAKLVAREKATQKTKSTKPSSKGKRPVEPQEPKSSKKTSPSQLRRKEKRRLSRIPAVPLVAPASNFPKLAEICKIATQNTRVWDAAMWDRVLVGGDPESDPGSLLNRLHNRDEAGVFSGLSIEIKRNEVLRRLRRYAQLATMPMAAT